MSDRSDRAAADRPASEPRLSPVIRALRYAGTEVQFGGALEAICQDPAVATAFAEAVTVRARRGNPAARRAARRPHGQVACLGEQKLQVRLTRLGAATRAKDAGRVDLQFSDHDGWTLAVELKLGAAFGPKQLRRYSELLPVAAIVREPEQLEDESRLKQNTNWVGVATWRTLLDDLRGLPVAAPWREQWTGLLDVMESDGDFDAGVPELPEVDAQVALLDAIAEPIVAHLASELATRYRARARVTMESPYPKPVGQDRVWAGFVTQAAGGPWLYIAIRNLFSDHPRLRILYYPVPGRRAQRMLRDAHARIERKGFVQMSTHYRFEKPIGRLRDAQTHRRRRSKRSTRVSPSSCAVAYSTLRSTNSSAIGRAKRGAPSCPVRAPPRSTASSPAPSHAGAEIRDRRMIRLQIRRDHPVRYVLHTLRSIPRDERLPIAYPYNNSATIIAGSYAARPCPFARYAP